MSKNKMIKILIDILMYADFLFLMNHGTIRDLTLHGYFGIALFLMFFLHHILNIWFYKIIRKGKYNAKRIVLNITDWLLFILMILMALSSVMMSGLIFEWSPIQTTQRARFLHLMSTSWGWIVMSVHLGLHTKNAFAKLERKIVSKGVKVILYLTYPLIFALGVFALIKSQLYVYMFNTGEWKMAAMTMTGGILEYVGITAGICTGINLIAGDKSWMKKQKNLEN